MFTESCPDIPIYTKTICWAPFIHRTGFVNISAVIGATVLSQIIMGYPFVLDDTFHIWHEMESELTWIWWRIFWKVVPFPLWLASCSYLQSKLTRCTLQETSPYTTLGKVKASSKVPFENMWSFPGPGIFLPSLHIKAQLFLVDDRPMICVKLCARAQNRKLVKGRKWRFCWTKMIQGQWKIQNSVDKKYSLDKSVLSLGGAGCYFCFFCSILLLTLRYEQVVGTRWYNGKTSTITYRPWKLNMTMESPPMHEEKCKSYWTWGDFPASHVLGGDFRCFLFSPRNPGEMIQFDDHIFLNGLKPPTSVSFQGCIVFLGISTFQWHGIHVHPVGQWLDVLDLAEGFFVLLLASGVFLEHTVGKEIYYMYTLEVNHHIKNGGSFWMMINPY